MTHDFFARMSRRRRKFPASTTTTVDLGLRSHQLPGPNAFIGWAVLSDQTSGIVIGAVMV